MASSAVSRIRNSPIHIVKMKNYGAGLDMRSVRDLAEVFRWKGRRKESDRNYRGRKISNFVTNKVDKKDMLSAWDKKKANPGQLILSHMVLILTCSDFLSLTIL